MDELEERNGIRIDESIDLSHEVCPMTFVLTKLKLEALNPGQRLEVILSDREAMRNIPISVKEEGHKILKAEKKHGLFHLIIEKSF